jgi:hypothetical protein
MSEDRDRGISRRAFTKSAVAIGGTAALSACLDWFGGPDVPQGPSDLSTLPTRQHAWNDALSTDQHGNVVTPRHHVLLLVNYDGSGRPSDGDREQIERAFRSLEHAYRRGNDGLLFTVGYTPSYFERFDGSLPEAVDLPAPAAMAPFEDPNFDTPDAIVHLASDYSQVVLAAEEVLKGNQSELNGIEMNGSFDGVFSVTDRRTGFIGEGLPAEHDDVDDGHCLRGRRVEIRRTADQHTRPQPEVPLRGSRRRDRVRRYHHDHTPIRPTGRTPRGVRDGVSRHVGNGANGRELAYRRNIHLRGPR